MCNYAKSVLENGVCLCYYLMGKKMFCFWQNYVVNNRKFRGRVNEKKRFIAKN